MNDLRPSYRGRGAPARRVEHVMGTVFSFDVRGAGIGEGVLDAAAGWLRWVDATFSTYRPDSAISRLGRGELRIADCPPEVYEVLDLCAQAGAATGGFFSATPVGRLDPTGLVKGWAIERASDLLRVAGSTDHAINGGGDVRTVGEPAPGRSWQVGVAHPLRPGLLAARVAGTDMAVATSGVAERGCHVVDPFTGRPATDLAGVTVVGPDLTLADAYATAALAMGRRARAWLEALPDFEAFAVTATGETWSTPGFGRASPQTGAHSP